MGVSYGCLGAVQGGGVRLPVGWGKPRAYVVRTGTGSSPTAAVCAISAVGGRRGGHAGPARQHILVITSEGGWLGPLLLGVRSRLLALGACDEYGRPRGGVHPNFIRHLLIRNRPRVPNALPGGAG
jgi:hypothetical protein